MSSVSTFQTTTTSPRGQWVNSLWPSDAISWHRSWSTLAQAMACCLTASSHYLKQWWLIISEILWHSPGSNFTRDTSIIIHWNYLENCLSRISYKSPRGQWVNRNCHMDKSLWVWSRCSPHTINLLRLRQNGQRFADNICKYIFFYEEV